VDRCQRTNQDRSSGMSAAEPDGFVLVDGYVVPVNPAEESTCEACQ
jgi:hypothetical protein